MEDFSLTNLLNCNVPARIQPVGLSMHPFIRRGDYVTIFPLSSDPRRQGQINILNGDCVIFRENPERWLIHRVIGINSGNGKIITKGDALLHPDPPVTREIIRGRVTIIHRANSGKEYRLDLPQDQRVCRLIAILSRGEAMISSIFRLRRREVKISPEFEFLTRIIKFPKWLLTRIFFP